MCLYRFGNVDDDDDEHIQCSNPNGWKKKWMNSIESFFFCQIETRMTSVHWSKKSGRIRFSVWMKKKKKYEILNLKSKKEKKYDFSGTCVHVVMQWLFYQVKLISDKIVYCVYDEWKKKLKITDWFASKSVWFEFRYSAFIMATILNYENGFITDAAIIIIHELNKKNTNKQTIFSVDRLMNDKKK